MYLIFNFDFFFVVFKQKPITTWMDTKGPKTAESERYKKTFLYGEMNSILMELF